MKLKLLFIALVATVFTNAQNTPLYVGTFTTEDSEGIYLYGFNTDTGELSNKTLAATSSSPSFIAYAPNRKYMYAVNRADDETKPDYVTAFKINNNGSLTLINTVDSHGSGPCHIAVNEKGTKAVISNYGSGTVSLYNINKDGSLNEASQVFNHNSETDKSHAHSAQFYKKDLFVADLGRNAVYQYKLKANHYVLESPAIVKMENNPGPRHFSMSKNGTYIYIINEYGNSITSVKRTKNGFEEIDFDSTLDENYKGKSFCADIHLSKNENFLYASNRGENSIAVFKRDKKTGMLDKIQNISVQGDWPRNFTLDPTGKFVLVANRRSSNISVFSIHATTGKLTFFRDYKTPNPVCLLF